MLLLLLLLLPRRVVPKTVCPGASGRWARDVSFKLQRNQITIAPHTPGVKGCVCLRGMEGAFQNGAVTACPRACVSFASSIFQMSDRSMPLLAYQMDHRATPRDMPDTLLYVCVRVSLKYEKANEISARVGLS